MSYVIDALGWLAGTAEADATGTIPVTPPETTVQEPTDGELWPRWRRYRWELQVWHPAPDGIVPDQVERWRAHYVLTAHGYMDAVMAAIDGMQDNTQRNLARAEFTQRPTIHRISYWTQLLQQAVGITDEERDQMFVEAQAL